MNLSKNQQFPEESLHHSNRVMEPHDNVLQPHLIWIGKIDSPPAGTPHSVLPRRASRALARASRAPARGRPERRHRGGGDGGARKKPSPSGG